MHKTPRHDRSLVMWLSLAQLVTWGSVFYTFALLLAPIERELGLDRAQASLAFSLALLAEGMLAYPVGRLIDRGYERLVMTGGSLLVGACLLLHSRIESALGFHAVWVGLGIGLAATLYTPAFAVITRRFPDDFRRAIITLTFLGGLASTVFIPLSAWLIDQLGWRQALWCLAALQFLLCAPIHALVLRGAGQARARQTKATAQSAVESGSLSQHLRSAPFLLIGVFVALMTGVTAALPPHMISLLREAHLPEVWVIAVPASIGVIQVLGRLVLYFFEHRFDLHVANRVIPWLIPLGLGFLLLGTGHPALALTFVALFGLGNGMITIVKGTAIALYVNRHHAASLNGALGLPTAIARALAPLALGLLWSVDAGYSIGIALMVLIAVLATLSLMLAQRLSRMHPLTRLR